MVDDAIEEMAAWMRSGHAANHGGAFQAAERTDALVAEARASVARLLGAGRRGRRLRPVDDRADHALLRGRRARSLQPGDEIVCTRLDHDANVAPWLIAAARAGAEVRFAEPDRETLELPAAAVEAVLSQRTRWVAVTAASNAVGTIPDLPGIVAAAHAAGARVFVDAVHATPHRAIDVAALGCDALACSAYKWFGPHIGILWARPELLGELSPDKLRPSPDTVPERWELGTLPFESLVGVAGGRGLRGAPRPRGAARPRGPPAGPDGRGPGRARRRDASTAPRATARATVMFTVDGHSSHDVAAHLARAEVAVWHGNYYALELSRWLGLEPDGALRAGVVAYNDSDDVDRLLEAVASSRPRRRWLGRRPARTLREAQASRVRGCGACDRARRISASIGLRSARGVGHRDRDLAAEREGRHELEAVAAPEAPRVVPARRALAREQAHGLVGGGHQLGAVDRLQRLLRAPADAALGPLAGQAERRRERAPVVRWMTSISRSSCSRSIVPSSWRTQPRWP